MFITRRNLLLAAPAIVLASRLDFVPRGLVTRRSVFPTGTRPKALWPGVQAWITPVYKPHDWIEYAHNP